MKVKIDKAFTPAETMDRVKAEAKDFGGMYTPGDLLRAFRDQTGTQVGYPEIIKVDVEAFDAGTNYPDKTSFKVEMVLDDFVAMYKISFYCGLGLEVDTRTLERGLKMYSVQKFAKVM